MSEPIHIISLGAGVQSSTMALMAAAGEITPIPVAAVFADTQAEPKSVYTWLDWLEKQLPFPVHRVTKVNLATEALKIRTAKKSGNRYTQYGIPAFILNKAGGIGLAQRQCTEKCKLDVIYREENKFRKSRKDRVLQWIGISADEISRIKPARKPWVDNRYPLIDLGMRRSHCLDWMSKRGFPKPPRSACIFCPYHSNDEWLRLRSEEPEAFAAAVQFEKDYQAALAQTTLMKGIPYLHRQLKPISEVDFSTEEERGQLNMFNNECEGMCGV